MWRGGLTSQPAATEAAHTRTGFGCRVRNTFTTKSCSGTPQPALDVTANLVAESEWGGENVEPALAVTSLRVEPDGEMTAQLPR